MADDVKVSNWPSASTKEQVAFDLMRVVMNAEGKSEHHRDGKPDRKYILDLYVECHEAARGVR